MDKSTVSNRDSNQKFEISAKCQQQCAQSVIILLFTPPRISILITTDIHNGSGPSSSLFLNTEVPKPHPATSQALIRIHSFGLNRMDLMQREGKYNVPLQAGKILGVEFSGWVVELGDGETGDFAVGDEVFGLAYGGGYI